MLIDANIFKQEGWHYELNSAKDELKTNGIVYNEMKGNETDMSSIMQYDTAKSLFPDTNYKWNSGGNPEDIVKLTYPELIKTYKKNYSPSNSYIFFYGDVDIQQMLKLMDTNYLKNYNKQKETPKLQVQKPFSKMNLVEDYYGITNDDTENDKTYITFNYKLTNALDKETNIAFNFLSNMLLGSESAPLRKALMDNGFSLAGANIDSSNYQSVFAISVMNTEDLKRAKIQEIINST